MIELAELQDAAQKAFPADQLAPSRNESWQLVAEMGWLMIRVPEDMGGLGLGREASTAILFELGRVLSAAPVIPALLVIEALVGSTLATRDAWIGRAVGGEYIAAGLLDGDVAQGDDGTLSGTLIAVADADMAAHLLVLAPGIAVLVPVDAAGVTVTERRLWDESRRLFDVALAGVVVDDALTLARGAEADVLAERLAGELNLALAADCLGGANAALEMSVEYLRTRKQFGRPLAMFQALKHRCADLKTRIEAADALLRARAEDAAASPVDLGALKALAADVYRFTAEEAIQFHGGIGLTQEYNCHLFMKRAFLNLQLGGSIDLLNEAAGRAALVEFVEG